MAHVADEVAPPGQQRPTLRVPCTEGLLLRQERNVNKLTSTHEYALLGHWPLTPGVHCVGERLPGE